MAQFNSRKPLDFQAPIFGFNVPYPSGGYGPAGPGPDTYDYGYDPTQGNNAPPTPKPAAWNLPPSNSLPPGATAVGPPRVLSPSIGSQIAAQQVATAPGSSAGAIPGVGGIPKYNEDIFGGDTDDTGGGDTGKPITDEVAKELAQEDADFARLYALLTKIQGKNQQIVVDSKYVDTYGMTKDFSGQNVLSVTGKRWALIPRLVNIRPPSDTGTLQRRVIDEQIFEGRWDANGQPIGALKRIPMPGENYRPVLSQTAEPGRRVTDEQSIPGYIISYIPDADGKPIPNTEIKFKKEPIVNDEIDEKGNVWRITTSPTGEKSKTLQKAAPVANWQTITDASGQPVSREQFAPADAGGPGGPANPNRAQTWVRMQDTGTGRVEWRLQKETSMDQARRNQAAAQGATLASAEQRNKVEQTQLRSQAAAGQAQNMASPAGQIASGRTPAELASLLNVAAGSPLPRVNVPPMSLDAYNRLNRRAQEALRAYLQYLGVDPDAWEQQQIAMWSSSSTAAPGVQWNTVRQGR